MLNVAKILDESTSRAAGKIALLFADQHWDYATLNAYANRVANGLRELGVQPGEKVALSCPNTPWFIAIYYGILKMGAVVVPLNTLLKGDEIGYHLRDSEAVCYFCHQGNVELPLLEYGRQGFEQVATCRTLVCIDEPNAPSPEVTDGLTLFSHFIEAQAQTHETVLRSELDLAVLLYTSGTTGRPKGAALSHSNILWNTRVIADMVEATPEDVSLTVLPLFHSFGQTCQMNASVLVGAANLIVPRFDAEVVLEAMVKHKVTMFAGVPTMYWGLLNAQPNSKRIRAICQHMRIMVSGGAAMPVEMIHQVKKVYQLPVYEGYGLSECAPVVTFNHPGHNPRVGSVGTPIWGMEVRIADEQGEPVKQGERGELLCRGHSVMTGYYNKPEESAKSMVNGWLCTGDIALEDDDGYLYIVDRAKDLIVRGGFNVYPREVEEMMLTHEAVSLVAVLGVPDQKYGEEIKAFVVPHQDASIDEPSLIAWCKEKMAAHKYPRQIEFREELPTNATGKILKRKLRTAEG